MTVYKAPNKGDLAHIRWLASRWHVSMSDVEVEAEIRARLAQHAKHARPARGERTIHAWVEAALTIHAKNRADYARIMRG